MRRLINELYPGTFPAKRVSPELRAQLQRTGQSLARFRGWERGRIGSLERRVHGALILAEHDKIGPVSTGWICGRSIWVSEDARRRGRTLSLSIGCIRRFGARARHMRCALPGGLGAAPQFCGSSRKVTPPTRPLFASGRRPPMPAASAKHQLYRLLAIRGLFVEFIEFLRVHICSGKPTGIWRGNLALSVAPRLCRKGGHIFAHPLRRFIGQITTGFGTLGV